MAWLCIARYPMTLKRNKWESIFLIRIQFQSVFRFNVYNLIHWRKKADCSLSKKYWSVYFVWILYNNNNRKSWLQISNARRILFNELLTSIALSVSCIIMLFPFPSLFAMSITIIRSKQLGRLAVWIRGKNLPKKTRFASINRIFVWGLNYLKLSKSLITQRKKEINFLYF